MAFLTRIQASAGSADTCALDNTGVHCWGGDIVAIVIMVLALVNPVAVSIGGGHACALDSNGVQCWGLDAYGQATPPVLVNPVAVNLGTITAAPLMIPACIAGAGMIMVRPQRRC